MASSSSSCISMSNQTIKKFAAHFKPIFRACDLGTFCYSNIGEKNELEFLLKYKLFSKLKPLAAAELAALKAPSTPPPLPIVLKPIVVNNLKSDHKELIKREWETHFAKGTLSFDDREVIQKVNKKLVYDEIIEENKDDNLLIKALNEHERDLALKKRPIENDEDNDDRLLIETLTRYENELESKRIKLEQYKEATKTFVSMERGIQLERMVIEKVNEIEGTKFVSGGGRLMSKDFGAFKVCGIVDGIDEERKILIEVKTKNRLSTNEKCISLRERIQCLCYMNMSECRECFLVESGPNGEQKMFRLVYDELEFKSKVLDKLGKFVDKYRNIERDEFISLLVKYPGLL
jgi:hypothetical protein